MTIRTIAIIAAFTVLLTGCGTLSKMHSGPIHDFNQELGEGYRAQRDAQILDPTPADDTPVTGIDAESAQRAIQKHRTPQTKDEAPTFATVITRLMNKK